MIIKAKEAGCHCVKFQSWSSDSLYAEDFLKKNTITKKFFEKYSLTSRQLKILANFSKKNKLDFSSTTYSFEELDFLVNECDPAFIKVASMDLNNHHYLKYISLKRKPIILSTGMSTIPEVIEAVNVIKRVRKNNDICIMHCISLYPAPKNLINLKNILGLKKEFPELIVGYSDHSTGIEFAIGAVSLGAMIIEKHFTLDKTLIGMDNHMAIEPNEMKDLVNSCNNIFTGLGSTGRLLSRIEMVQKKKMRRSIVSNKYLKKGSILTLEDINFKRPGTGIAPNDVNEVIGKKIIKNIHSGEILKKSFFKESFNVKIRKV